MPDNPKSDVSIVVAGKELSRWLEYSIESNMLQTVDSFHFAVANPRGKLSGEFKEFDEAKVYVDGSLQMTGYIDDVSTGADPRSGPTLELIGRDRFGQLTDKTSEPRTFNNEHLADIASKLSVPFVEEWIYDNEANRTRQKEARSRVSRRTRISEQEKAANKRKRDALTSLGSDPQIQDQKNAALLAVGKLNQQAIEQSKSSSEDISKAKANLSRIKAENFPRVKVEKGDRPIEVIVKYAQKVGVLVWLSADGKGILARPNYNQPVSGNLWQYIREKPESTKNNCLGSRAIRSGRGRFRKYRLLGYAANTRQTSGEGSRFDQRFEDPDVTLEGRELVIARAQGQTLRQTAAELERDVQRRKFDAIICDYIVRGHFQDIGSSRNLWTVDTLVNVDDDLNDVHEKMYVVRRRFTGGNEGQRTELTLRRAGIFYP